jgi:hypothetical protein
VALEGQQDLWTNTVNVPKPEVSITECKVRKEGRRLHCQVRTDPADATKEYKWLHNGVEIPEAENKDAFTRLMRYRFEVLSCRVTATSAGHDEATDTGYVEYSLGARALGFSFVGFLSLIAGSVSAATINSSPVSSLADFASRVQGVDWFAFSLTAIMLVALCLASVPFYADHAHAFGGSHPHVKRLTKWVFYLLAILSVLLFVAVLLVQGLVARAGVDWPVDQWRIWAGPMIVLGLQLLLCWASSFALRRTGERVHGVPLIRRQLLPVMLVSVAAGFFAGYNLVIINVAAKNGDVGNYTYWVAYILPCVVLMLILISYVPLVLGTTQPVKGDVAVQGTPLRKRFTLRAATPREVRKLSKNAMLTFNATALMVLIALACRFSVVATGETWTVSLSLFASSIVLSMWVASFESMKITWDRWADSDKSERIEAFSTYVSTAAALGASTLLLPVLLQFDFFSELFFLVAMVCGECLFIYWIWKAKDADEFSRPILGGHRRNPWSGFRVLFGYLVLALIVLDALGRLVVRVPVPDLTSLLGIGAMITVDGLFLGYIGKSLIDDYSAIAKRGSWKEMFRKRGDMLLIWGAFAAIGILVMNLMAALGSSPFDDRRFAAGVLLYIMAMVGSCVLHYACFHSIRKESNDDLTRKESNGD